MTTTGMTTMVLPTSIAEEQDTHSCAKCKLVFLNLNDYFTHKLSRDNCKVSYTKSKGSKVLIPTIIQKKNEVIEAKPTPKGKKRGPKGPHKKVELEAIMDSTPGYTCEQCPKSFRRKAALVRHLEFDHQGEGTEGQEKATEEDEQDVRTSDDKDKDYKPNEPVHVKTEPGTDGPKTQPTRPEQEAEVEPEPEFETMSMSGVQILVRPSKSLVQPAYDPEHYKVSSARPHQCHICKRAFKDANVLKAHMLTHTDERDHPCTWKGCSYAFKTKGSLKRHMRRHTGERPFRCELCGRCFGESGALTRHLKSRTPCVNKSDIDLPRYGQAATFIRDIPAARGKTGELLGEELATAQKPLASHSPPPQARTIIVTQPPGVPLSAEDLMRIGEATGDSSLGERLLMAEQSVTTGENGEQQIIFTLCPETTSSVDKHPPLEQQDHVCQVCSEQFESKETLLEHLKVHMTLPRHRCDYCNHSAASENDLILHMRITHKMNPSDIETTSGAPQVIQVISSDTTQPEIINTLLQQGQLVISDQLEMEDEGQEVVATFNEAGQQILTSLDGRVINLQELEGQVIEEVDSIEAGVEVISRMEHLIENQAQANSMEGVEEYEGTRHMNEQVEPKEQNEQQETIKQEEIETQHTYTQDVLVYQDQDEEIKQETDVSEETPVEINPADIADTIEDTGTIVDTETIDTNQQNILYLDNMNEESGLVVVNMEVVDNGERLVARQIQSAESELYIQELEALDTPAQEDSNIQDTDAQEEASIEDPTLHSQQQSEVSAQEAEHMAVSNDTQDAEVTLEGEQDDTAYMEEMDTDNSCYSENAEAVYAEDQEEAELEEDSVQHIVSQEDGVESSQDAHNVHLPTGNQAAELALQQTLSLHGGTSSSKVGSKTMHNCPVCCRTFQSSHYLKLHLRSHIGERPHTCQVCSKKFMTRDSLIKHMVVHSNERNYKCGDCGKLFKRISHVREHLKVHNSDRPFPCMACNKSFKSSNACKVHMRTHSDMLPHECYYCKRHFREKGSLQRHLRTHTGEKPYSCQFCNRCFAEHGTLNRHLKAKIPCRGRGKTDSSSSSSLGQEGGTAVNEIDPGTGEHTVLAEFSTVVADTQQYIVSEPQQQQESVGELDGSEVLVLADEESMLQPVVTEIADTDELQPGEYAIVSKTDDMITIKHKLTGQTINMPARTFIPEEGDGGGME